MSKKVGIALLCLIVLMAGLAYAGYEHHQKTSTYKYRVMAYMKKFDPTIEFEYVNETPKEYRPLVGYFVTVHLRNVKTGEIREIGFNNGRLMPMFERNSSIPLIDQISPDVEEEADFISEIILIALIFILMLTVCLAYIGYEQHRCNNTYKNKALAYMRKSDPSMTFEYLDETPERKPDWFNGIVTTVFIKNVSTGTIWAVEFLNGKVDYERRVDESTLTNQKTDNHKS